MAAHLKAKISLDTSGFIKGLRSIQARLTSFASSIATVAKGASKAFALIGLGIAGLSIGKMINLVRKTLNFKEALKEAGVSVDDIGKKFRGFSSGLVSGLAPAIGGIADMLESIDFKAVGQTVGESLQKAVNVLVNAFKQGKIGELVSLSLKIGFMEAANVLIKAIQASISFLGGSMKAIFSADFFNALVLGFAGVVKLFQAGLIEALKTPIAFLSAGFDKITLELAIGMAKALEALAKDSPITQKIFGQMFNKSEDLAKMRKPFSKLMEENSRVTEGVSGGLRQEGQQLLGMSAGVIKGVGVQQIAELVKALRVFKEKGFFDTSKDREKVQGLINDLSAQEFGKKRGALPEPILKQEAASSLERIGAIMGGGAAMAQLNFSRDTARNTAIIAKHIVKLGQSRGDIQGLAVFQ